MKFRLLIVFALLAAAIGSFTTPAALAQDETPATVRVMHASPDAPAVDIYVNGAQAYADVPYFTVSDYGEVPAGDIQVQITPAGAPVEEAVLDQSVSLSAGQVYTLAATGLLADGSLQLSIFEESLAPTDQARVDVFHLVPGAGAVDIRLSDGTILIDDLDFRESEEISVDAGTYDLAVTAGDAAETVLLELPGTQLDAGTAYHVFAIDSGGALAAEVRAFPVGTSAPAEEATPEPVPAETETPTEEPTPAEDPTPEPAAETDEDSVLVRVVHASPNAPAVDVYIDGSLALSGVPYFTASGYVTLPAGERLVQVTPAGASPDDAVISANLPLTGGNAYTIAAIGLLENIEARLFEDNRSDVSGVDARVTVYHLSPDAPAVDVKVGPEGAIILENIAFGESDNTDEDQGTYDIFVTPAGEADPVLSFPGTELQGGTSYDVFAIGLLGDGSLQAQITANGAPISTAAPAEPAPTEAPTEAPTPEPAPTAPPAAGTSQVSIVHASPDAPAVDVYVDGSAVLTDVPFFTASDYLELPAGEHRIQITPAGASPDDAVIDATFDFAPGTAYTAAAIGLLENIELNVLIDDLSPAAAGEAVVSVFHYSPDAPAVDVKLADGTVLAPNVPFGSGFEFTVPAGTYDLIVTPAGATEPVVIDLPGTTLQEGNYYSVYAVGTLDSIQAELRVTPIGTEAPEAPETPTETPQVPVQLPETSEGSSLPVEVLALSALLLLTSGALVLGLRRRLSR